MRIKHAFGLGVKVEFQLVVVFYFYSGGISFFSNNCYFVR